MNLCDICPKPGNCCNNLQLNTKDPGSDALWSFWKSDGVEPVKARLEEYDLPFEPTNIVQERIDSDTGEVLVRYGYNCTKLLDNGRCGIYEDRPQVCRDYAPGQDGLCVFNSSGVLRDALT